MYFLSSLIVNGGWSEWGAYRACSKSCGGGTQSRSRQCNNPSPAHGGHNCSGASSDLRSCNELECPGKHMTSSLIFLLLHSSYEQEID